MYAGFSLACGDCIVKACQNSSDRQSLTLQAKQILIQKAAMKTLGMYTKLEGFQFSEGQLQQPSQKKPQLLGLNLKDYESYEKY
jgi:hypothetical protein